MANTTNYTLPLLNRDDFVTQTQWQRVMYVLSSCLGNFLKTGNGGVISGWTLNDAKTVAAGEGVVEGTMPKTTNAQAITGLTNGVVNYVYAQINSTSHDDTRTVDFIASTSTANPSGTLRLGSMTLDGSGTVTAKDNNPDGYRRDYWRGRRVNITEGTWTNDVAIPVGEIGMDVVSHSADTDFTGPTEIRVTAIDEGWYAWAQPIDGGSFWLFVMNCWTAGYDYDYYSYDPNFVQVTWEREGVI